MAVDGGMFGLQVWPEPGDPDYGQPGVITHRMYGARCGACGPEAQVWVIPATRSGTSEDAIPLFIKFGWTIEEGRIRCEKHAP